MLLVSTFCSIFATRALQLSQICSEYGRNIANMVSFAILSLCLLLSRMLFLFRCFITKDAISQIW